LWRIVWTVPVWKLGLPGVQDLRLRLEVDYGKGYHGPADGRAQAGIFA
jgi:hypothetical protein